MTNAATETKDLEAMVRIARRRLITACATGNQEQIDAAAQVLVECLEELKAA